MLKKIISLLFCSVLLIGMCAQEAADRGYIVKVRAGGAERYIVKRGSIWQLLQLAQRGALRLAA